MTNLIIPTINANGAKTNLKATLNFPNQNLAKSFTTAWACHTLEGHVMSSINDDGSFDVTVYNVDDDRKQWIDNYVQGINE